ncbi:MAG: DUF4013 domain-containing protein [Nanoarchaeota archaeon]|nr:DUF4013 domain-containing protein [Nanoarchaeota archaeon]
MKFLLLTKEVLALAKKKINYSEFKEGLSYPWRDMKKLWNILWVLIPILGHFALMGYVKKIVNELVKGNNKSLPAFGNFWTNLRLGFWVFIKLVPLMLLLSFINLLPWIGGLVNAFLCIFFIPYLAINFLVTGKFADLFDYKKVIKNVFNNAGEYLIAFFKTLGYMVIYYLLSFVLIGIPCLTFGQFYFLTEFYAKYQK